MTILFILKNRCLLLNCIPSFLGKTLLKTKDSQRDTAKLYSNSILNACYMLSNSAAVLGVFKEVEWNFWQGLKPWSL